MSVNSGAAPQPGGYAGPTSAEAGHAVPQSETVGAVTLTDEERDAQAQEAKQIIKDKALEDMATYGDPAALEELESKGESDDPEPAEPDPAGDGDSAGDSAGDSGGDSAGDSAGDSGGDGAGDSGGDGDKTEGDEDDDKPEDYSAEEWTYQTLKDEIDKRNEGREDDVKLSKGGSAEELRARLVADDEAQAAAAAELENQGGADNAD